MHKVSNHFHDRGFWLEENLRYSEPYFRLKKCARIVNALSRGRPCDLLDVGCGPATLAKLLQPNIHYYGIDLAIHDPAPNLIEMDLAQNEIQFQGKFFDIIVAAGFFEYIGRLQNQKLMEIRGILKETGKCVFTYTNFAHLHRSIAPTYNNIKSIEEFRADLSRFFVVERCFPSSHNWIVREPRRRLLQFQIYLHMHIPLISRLFAMNYFFICSRQ
jgi:SAM-dependent methyltransferase